ncbi:creatininase family protein [Chelativorans sp. Marseille-P2723]|uniref:creatininase family protein n=1 Tax=Chelativorans sp. Marseille-P2723 TaxID=2709133 RepID=UPI0015713B45|nr:creatininase family protein [Chelativorans sp. Marseille-P2723]
MSEKEREAPTGTTIAVLPLGATEQHGPHLPPETDWMIAEAVASRAMACLRAGTTCAGTTAGMTVEFLPVEKLGYSIEHSHDPTTHSLGFDEAVRRWIGIGEACADRGIGKFVLLNAHGGNAPLMTIVATELRVRRNMLAVATSWTRFGTPHGLVTEEERALGIHGGYVETSVMLALRPDLVQMDKAKQFPSAQADFQRDFRHLRAYGPHAFGWMMKDLSPEGAAGDAASASAEAGERILDHACNGFLELLDDVARFDLGHFGVR